MRRSNQEASNSIALVSLSARTLPALAPHLDLDMLDALSRFVEAYLLHERVVLLANSADAVPVPIRSLGRDSGGVRVEIRFDVLSDGIHPLLAPHISSEVSADWYDLEHMLRAVRSVSASQYLKHLPKSARRPNEWLGLFDRIDFEVVRAELSLAERLGGTYYSSPFGTQVIGKCSKQFGDSAASLLLTFTELRSSKIAEFRRLVRQRDIEISPPLLLAYAVNSAQTLKGFLTAVEEMRSDSATVRLRRLVTRLANADPAEGIELSAAIRGEFQRILGPASANGLVAPEVVRSVPSLLAHDWGKVIGSAAGFLQGDFLQRLRIARHLSVLRKVHRAVPSVRGFHQDLARVFGRLAFDEKELQLWLTRPRAPSLRLPATIDERAFKEKTAHMFERLNKDIRRMKPAEN